jgi:hypothetical protein
MHAILTSKWELRPLPHVFLAGLYKQVRIMQPAESRNKEGAARRRVHPSSEKGDFAWWGDINAKEYKHILDHIPDDDSDFDP